MARGGLLKAARPGSVIVVHSTIHPETVVKLAKVAELQGVFLIDANMSSGARGAQRQEPVYMVGGADEAVEKSRPVLEASGKRIFRTGPTGSAAATKLAQQAILVGTMMAVEEGLFMAEKAGVDRETLIKIMNESGGPCRGSDWPNRFSRLNEETVAAFYAGIVPAIKLAHEVAAPVPGLAVAQQLLALRSSVE